MAGPVVQLCTHLNDVRDVVPRTPEGCEECLQTGSWWVHLRGLHFCPTSAGNNQPWEFEVVRDRNVLAQLARIDGADAGHLANAEFTRPQAARATGATRMEVDVAS